MCAIGFIMGTVSRVGHIRYSLAESLSLARVLSIIDVSLTFYRAASLAAPLTIIVVVCRLGHSSRRLASGLVGVASLVGVVVALL